MLGKKTVKMSRPQGFFSVQETYIQGRERFLPQMDIAQGDMCHVLSEWCSSPRKRKVLDIQR
jgi:hypothetical protein